MPFYSLLRPICPPGTPKISVADLLLLGGVAIYAFRISAAGKPLFQKGFLEE